MHCISSLQLLAAGIVSVCNNLLRTHVTFGHLAYMMCIVAMWQHAWCLLCCPAATVWRGQRSANLQLLLVAIAVCLLACRHKVFGVVFHWQCVQ